MSASRRTGFTLIELLVVIAIIAVLIGLLLPAIQKVRESAARSTCTNNIKQLALAFHSFENEHGYIQSSIRTASNGRQGWQMFLLPYLEQAALWALLDKELGWNEGTNRPLVGTKIATSICPSAPVPERQDGAPDDPTPWTEFAAPTDYGVIYGLDARLSASGLVDPGERTGIMPRNLQTRFAEVLDGLSTTILVVESAGRPQVYRNNLKFGTLPTNRVNGGGWSRPASDFELKGSTSNGATFPGPCGINCTNGDLFVGYPDATYGTLGTGEIFAFHSGGANIAFGDGSVRLLRERTPIRLVAQFVTRNNGETVTDLP
jgi:prepilin-type N-terminal cleavage/methylation domain-containing protein/prepilin-type processing-associated H-X9-DG protein